MKYVLMIYEDENAGWRTLSPAEQKEFFGGYGQLTQELKEGGRFAGGARLQPTTAATSVRLRSGERLITDGPFAETREHLGGFYVIEASDLDEAVEVASRIPSVRLGTIEIRPVVETPSGG